MALLASRQLAQTTVIILLRCATCFPRYIAPVQKHVRYHDEPSQLTVEPCKFGKRGVKANLTNHGRVCPSVFQPQTGLIGF